MEETRQQRRARERTAKQKKTSEDKQISRIVGGRVDGKTYDKWPGWEGRGVPTRENCDLANPRQAFLWMYTAPPGQAGAPLMMPTEYFELLSWRMWVLGARPVAEPTQKWQAPVNATANPWTAAGKWVDVNTPEPERKTVAQMMRELPAADRAEIRGAVLAELGYDGEALPDKDRPGPPAMTYTVAALAQRLNTTVDELLVVLGNLGLTNATASTTVGRDVADRIVAHLGLG
ncbi:phage gene 29 protein family protein [Nocardia sp. NPDC055165]